MKNNKGITLIALVITIIVLLILAGVSIAMLTGENGILNQASKAGSSTQVAEAKELAGIDVSTALSKFYEDKYTNANTTLGSTTPGQYLTTKGNVTSSYPDKYTIDGATITIIPLTDGGKQVKGTINSTTGAITWEEADPAAANTTPGGQ